jgi:hypothetical protein
MSTIQSQKQRIMSALHCTEAEAEEIMQADKAIDRGEKMPFDLTAEQEKVARKFAKTGTRKAPTAYALDNTGGKRSRKENPTKASIIAELAKFLENDSENACVNVSITNKERQIAFSIGENSYELTLVQKRKPK